MDNKNEVYKRVFLARDDVIWFHEQYGPNATFTWLFSRMLKNFRELHERDTRFLIREAAKESYDEIESEEQ